MVMATNYEPEQKYEFSAPQNIVISGLSSFMKIFGIICIIGGVLMVLGSFMVAKGLSSDQLQGVFVIILGVLQYRASGAFRAVVTTHGDDIHHLMNALGILKNIYKIQVVLILVVFVLAVVLAVFTAGKA
jgi:hypothetical protein